MLFSRAGNESPLAGAFNQHRAFSMIVTLQTSLRFVSSSKTSPLSPGAGPHTPIELYPAEFHRQGHRQGSNLELKTIFIRQYNKHFMSLDFRGVHCTVCTIYITTSLNVLLAAMCTSTTFVLKHWLWIRHKVFRKFFKWSLRWVSGSGYIFLRCDLVATW